MKHHFEKYCKDYENIENYEAAKKDNFIGWECHHRRGANITQKELIALGQYYNISSDELVFLTTAEHNQFHHIGRHHTEESKKRIGAASKGRRHTEEARKKMSDAAKGKNIWSKCTHWYNNGKINTMAKECPPGFVPGRIKKL